MTKKINATLYEEVRYNSKLNKTEYCYFLTTNKEEDVSILNNLNINYSQDFILSDTTGETKLETYCSCNNFDLNEIEYIKDNYIIHYYQNINDRIEKILETFVYYGVNVIYMGIKLIHEEEIKKVRYLLLEKRPLYKGNIENIDFITFDEKWEKKETMRNFWYVQGYDPLNELRNTFAGIINSLFYKRIHFCEHDFDLKEFLETITIIPIPSETEDNNIYNDFFYNIIRSTGANDGRKYITINRDKKDKNDFDYFDINYADIEYPDRIIFIDKDLENIKLMKYLQDKFLALNPKNKIKFVVAIVLDSYPYNYDKDDIITENINLNEQFDKYIKVYNKPKINKSFT